MIKPHYFLHTVLIFNLLSTLGGNALWRSTYVSAFGKAPDLCSFRRCGGPVCVVGGRQLVKQAPVPCSDSNCTVKSDLALYTHVMAKG